MAARIPDEVKARFAGDYASGLKMSEVAEKNGVSLFAVRSHLAGLGVERRKERIPMAKRKMIAEAYEAGDNIEDMEERFGVSRHAIKTIRDQMGIKPRGAGRQRKDGSPPRQSDKPRAPQTKFEGDWPSDDELRRMNALDAAYRHSLPVTVGSSSLAGVGFYTR